MSIVAEIRQTTRGERWAFFWFQVYRRTWLWRARHVPARWRKRLVPLWEYAEAFVHHWLNAEPEHHADLARHLLSHPSSQYRQMLRLVGSIQVLFRLVEGDREPTDEERTKFCGEGQYITDVGWPQIAGGTASLLSVLGCLPEHVGE